MADLQTKSLETLVRDAVTAVQGGSSRYLIDLSVGSILRAALEAMVGVALWLQGLVLRVLALTRAATSSGADLDTWMADFGLIRLGATFATGQATFSRFTATSQAVVPIGAQVQSTDGAQRYVVTLDTSNTAYNAGLGGYVIGADVPDVTVPISAATAGAGGNASIGGVNTLGQAIPGVDTVTNTAALVNGSNAESDTAFRIRFVRYLASLAKATKAAIGYAATAVQSGITHNLVENEEYDGDVRLGYFYVVVDDGSGEPSDDLISSIYSAIDLARGFTINFGVFGPTVVTADIAMGVVVHAGYDATAARAAVQAAISAYVNGLSLAQSLVWSRLIQVAFDATPGVDKVSTLTINSLAADLAATAKQVIRTGTVTVT